jgi:4-oxalocrotonate tautomerase
MPLVRVDLLETYSPEQRRTIADCVQRAMVQTLGVPERDRFQIVTAHSAQDFVFDRSYLDIERSDGFVLVHVTLSAGRTVEAKQEFYSVLADLLADGVGLRPEDLAVVMVENQRHDWSFGNGQASYVVLPSDQWR